MPKEPCSQSFFFDGHVTLACTHHCCLYRCGACILLLTCKADLAQMVDGQDVKGMDLPALVERIPHENRRCILYRLVDKPGAASGQQTVCCLYNTSSLHSPLRHQKPPVASLKCAVSALDSLCCCHMLQSSACFVLTPS